MKLSTIEKTKQKVRNFLDTTMEYMMMRMTVKVALVLVGIHLLLGVVQLVIGVNDQNFSYLIALLYYYLNYSAVWLLESMKVEVSLILVILMGVPQWILLSLIVGPIVNLFVKKKKILDAGQHSHEPSLRS